jgi:hypothetical protein
VGAVVEEAVVEEAVVEEVVVEEVVVVIVAANVNEAARMTGAVGGGVETKEIQLINNRGRRDHLQCHQCHRT